MSDRCEPPWELREKIARAINEGLGESWSYSNHSGDEWAQCRDMLDSAADAVLAALHSASYVVVPREPTPCESGGTLLPCPFCASHDCRIQGARGSFIQCAECMAESNLMQNDADAVAAWNRRSPNAEVEALKEDYAAVRAELCACVMAGIDLQDEAAKLRARVAELESIARMLAGFAEKAATLDWDEDNNVTWAAVVAAKARAALSPKTP